MKKYHALGFVCLWLFGYETHAADPFVLSAQNAGGKIFSMSWPASGSMLYAVYATSDLGAPWQQQVAADGNGAGTYATALADSRRFFLVAASPQPLNPLAGLSFYADPNSQAAMQAQAWKASRPADAAILEKIAKVPQAFWPFGDAASVRSALASLCVAAGEKALIVTLYNIPYRDCGGYSSGGAAAASAYAEWIEAAADGIGTHKAVVVLEPDALAAEDCLPIDKRHERELLIKNAVHTVHARSKALAYIEGGHARWKPAADMAARLLRAGLDDADGFALNVSNYIGDAETIKYGLEISKLAHNKHFIIDSSRNGRGPTANNEWCNAPDRALGIETSTASNEPLLDGRFWIKRIGESDGPCNGGPAAGVFWADYALMLGRNAGY